MKSISRRRIVCTLALAASTFAIGITGAQAQQLTKLTLTMEFTPGGFHTPFYLAQQKGWFKEAGIDLTIRDGKGSGNTINLVGAGQSDLGFTPGSAAIIARSKGIPVKTIATIMNKNAYGIVFNKRSQIRSASDLKGKELIYTVGSMEGVFTESFLASAKLSKSDVKLLGVDSTAKAASVIAGKSDGAVAPVPYYVGLLAGKQEIGTLLYHDFGDKLVDIGIIANEDAIKQKPAALKAFVDVMSRAFTYTRDKSAEEAAAALVALRPDAGIDVPSLVNMFRAYAAHIDTPDSQGKPIGYISEVAWAQSVDTLKRLNVIPKDAKATDMYTTAFSPK
jgi:NitT/TauT family transport system substrate-binding protein